MYVQTKPRKSHFESGIGESRKRNDLSTFPEPSSESATTQSPQIAENPLFIACFSLIQSLNPWLARALRCARVENCIEVREVCS